MTTSTQYAFQTTLDLPYEKAIEKVAGALKEEGFGVLTEIDVKATLKQKLDADFRRYVILGACNPNLAHRALSTDLSIGLLLPCNVIVYEQGEDEEASGTVVAIIDPIAMLSMADQEAVKPIAEDARARLERVVAALSA